MTVEAATGEHGFLFVKETLNRMHELCLEKSYVKYKLVDFGQSSSRVTC